MLFENERLHISKLYSVNYYAPRGAESYTYPGKLPSYELMYYIKGDTKVCFAGRAYHMTPDTMLYLPKGLENEEYTVRVKEDFSLHNIYFDTWDPMPKEPVLISARSGEIRLVYEKLYREWLRKRAGYYFACMKMVYHILELTRKQQESYNVQPQFAKLLPAEEYLASHYCDHHFSYNELTERTGLSYSYFKKLFIDKYGMPPVKYVANLKINRACELLQTQKYSIAQIAELCGYENIYYFSNVFKKHKGVSPANYKLFDEMPID